MKKNTIDNPEEKAKAKLREMKRREYHWYVLFVHGNHERAIIKKLLEREQENESLPSQMRRPKVVEQAFVPIKQVKRKWSDRTKVVDVVMTTGMVFVRMKMEYQRDIYIDPYIKHFLYDRDSRTPAIIPDEQMDAFITCSGRVEDISVGMPEVGQKVRILCGPYEGKTGYLIRKVNSFRFQMCLCSNLAFQFSISESDVAPVSPDAEDIIPDVRY